MPVAPPFAEFFRVFLRIGCLSFGGPAGQIALMHKELVEERKWVDEQDYLHALNFCHFLPGPEAQQLATWIGWHLHGTKGGVVAGLLFVLPGALVILSLSMLYGFAAHLEWFSALFLGIKAAVLAIVMQAVARMAKRSADTVFKRSIAIAAFVGLFFFNLPFPLIVFGAALLGIAVAAHWPALLNIAPPTLTGPTGPPPWRASIKAAIIWGAIWAAPMLLIASTLGTGHILWDIAIFFSKLAIVTFGGAYAVLAYVAQEAVNGLGWVSAGEMADGLGLAETTPGPLIMVTQFVGYLAAFRESAPFSPILAGLLAATVTTWVTFSPCFLWIFAFAPWLERLQHATKLKAGLATLSAAVVGVITNLSLWFALHVIFGRVDEKYYGPFRLLMPDWSSLDWKAVILAGMAFFLIFKTQMGTARVLLASAFAGLLLGSFV